MFLDDEIVEMVKANYTENGNAAEASLVHKELLSKIMQLAYSRILKDKINNSLDIKNTIIRTDRLWKLACKRLEKDRFFFLNPDGLLKLLKYRLGEDFYKIGLDSYLKEINFKEK